MEPGYYFLIGVAAAIAVVFAVLAIRAQKLKARPQQEHEAFFKPIDSAEALRRFSLLLQKKTVWPRNGTPDLTQFESFLPLLQELYPRCFAAFETHTVNDYGILLRWKGTDETKAPVVLMSHYDVVAADESKWTLPPFCGEEHAGYIWGRGAVDTKCILAALLEASETLLKEGFAPARDIYFSFTNNEETGGDTTPAVVEWFRSRGIRPWFVLDEGGAVVHAPAFGVKQDFAMVGVSEKGVIDAIVNVRGVPGHSATPKDTDSTYRLIKVCNEIEHHPFEAHLSPATKQMLREIAGYASFGMRLVFANLWLFAPLVKLIMSQNPETNAMLRTTVALTKLRGSDVINVIPTSAQAGFSVRVAPWDTDEKIIKRLRSIAGEHAELTSEYTVEPSPVSPTDCDAFALIADTVDAVYPAVKAVPYVMNGGTDAKHFASICENVYRFGGFRFSNEERASMHGNDEKLKTQSYLDGIQFYIKLLMNLNEGGSSCN
ncbi:MAG: M20/M25/M40 family metallo-hydrolase [Clostridia bacterium]|nr:M20/M25/M40 family metallo-hydrolase [Clostridia bacterium]